MICEALYLYLRMLAAVVLPVMLIAGSVKPAFSEGVFPAFVKSGVCISVTAIHEGNQYGLSENGRTVHWQTVSRTSDAERRRRNELRLCFFKRGTQIAVKAYSWVNDGWSGPHASGLRDVLVTRDLSGKKLESGCLAIHRELPGGYGRLKHVMKSDKICDLSDRFRIHHERVIDEGDKRDGTPARVLRKIFTANIVHSEPPLPDADIATTVPAWSFHLFTVFTKIQETHSGWDLKSLRHFIPVKLTLNIPEAFF